MTYTSRVQVQTCLRSMQLYVQQEQKKACHLSVLSIVKEYYLFKSLLNDAAMVWRNLLTKSHQVFRIYIIHHPFCNYYDIYISKTKQNKKITTQCISIYSPFFSLLLILFYILSDMSMIIHITWLLTTPSSLLLFFLAVSRTDFQNMRLILRWIKTCPTQ